MTHLQVMVTFVKVLKSAVGKMEKMSGRETGTVHTFSLDESYTQLGQRLNAL